VRVGCAQRGSGVLVTPGVWAGGIWPDERTRRVVDCSLALVVGEERLVAVGRGEASGLAEGGAAGAVATLGAEVDPAKAAGAGETVGAVGVEDSGGAGDGTGVAEAVGAVRLGDGVGPGAMLGVGDMIGAGGVEDSIGAGDGTGVADAVGAVRLGDGVGPGTVPEVGAGEAVGTVDGGNCVGPGAGPGAGEAVGVDSGCGEAVTPAKGVAFGLAEGTGSACCSRCNAWTRRCRPVSAIASGRPANCPAWPISWAACDASARTT